MSTARVRVSVVQQQGMTPLWFANHETGNFSTSGWTLLVKSGNATVTFVTDRKHSGKYGLKLTVNTASGTDTAVRLVVNRMPKSGGGTQPFPNEAYYSCWYWIPANVGVGSFWNILDFKSALKRTDGSREALLTYFLQIDPVGNEYRIRLGDRVKTNGWKGNTGDPGVQNAAATSAVNLPSNQWVHLEVYYKWSYTTSGRITCWVNGRLGFDLTGIVTEYDKNVAPNPSVYLGPHPVSPREFKVNHYSNNLNPDFVSIWVDDAVIASQRVYGKTVLGL